CRRSLIPALKMTAAQGGRAQAMDAMLAWLATYAVHSTLLLGGVALLTAFVVRREAWRETLWKAALVGGLLTSTVQVALGIGPLAGAMEPQQVSPLRAPPIAAAPAPAGLAKSAPDETPVRPQMTRPETGHAGPAAGSGAALARGWISSWPVLVIALWGGVVA